MNIIAEIFLGLLSVSEILMIFTTFYYLYREYRKAVEKYDKKKKHHTAKKDKALKGIIKDNTTERIDSTNIDDFIGYARLDFIKDGKSISSRNMCQDKIVIGRDYRNDIVIKDRTVSRQQCLIKKRNGKFILTNFGKKNFTCLNDEIIKNKTEIKYGDIVKMGRITFRFSDII